MVWKSPWPIQDQRCLGENALVPCAIRQPANDRPVPKPRNALLGTCYFGRSAPTEVHGNFGHNPREPLSLKSLCPADRRLSERIASQLPAQGTIEALEDRHRADFLFERVRRGFLAGFLPDRFDAPPESVLPCGMARLCASIHGIAATTTATSLLPELDLF